MELILIVVIGILVSTAVYLILQKALLRLVIGLNILSQAINLIIFTAGKSRSHQPAFIASDQSQLVLPSSDPLPQALILTAIVIGFAMIAFFVVITYRVFDEAKTDQIDQLTGEQQC